MGKKRGFRDFLIVALALVGTMLIIFGMGTTPLVVMGTLSILLSIIISLSRFFLK